MALDQPNSSASLNRRHFMQVSLVGGAFVATMPMVMGRAEAKDSKNFEGEIGVFIRVTPENELTIGAPCGEMGQETFTSIPMILAEEMDADWDNAHIEFMPALVNEDTSWAYADQAVGGSHTVRNNYDYMRQAGAAIRYRFIHAAAVEMSLNPDSLRTEKNIVYHDASKRQMTYGQLASKAALVEVPEGDLSLKDPSSFKILNRPSRIKGSRDLVTGADQFGTPQIAWACTQPRYSPARRRHQPSSQVSIRAMTPEVRRALPGASARGADRRIASALATMPCSFGASMER